jgi:hypothetical protein
MNTFYYITGIIAISLIVGGGLYFIVRLAM